MVQLWHLREELSRSGRVVYAKWYKGRATFLSQTVAGAVMARMDRAVPSPTGAPRRVLQLLEENSPISSKILKKRLNREHGLTSIEVDKAFGALWPSLKIVGYGEVEDGAFPSLAIGATSVLFENVYREALRLGDDEVGRRLEVLAPGPFGKHLLALTTKRRVSAGGRVVVKYDELVGAKR